MISRRIHLYRPAFPDPCLLKVLALQASVDQTHTTQYPLVEVVQHEAESLVQIQKDLPTERYLKWVSVH